MAIRNTALTPFNPTAIPDRLTPLYVTDKRVTTTTAGTGAVQRLNRVQSASFSESVPVQEVSEMGAQNRVGGVDDLGEATFKIDFNQVGMVNMAAVVGKTIDPVSGHTTNIALADFQSAQVDVIRLAADSANTIFGTLYMQDCFIEDYQFDVKNKSAAGEQVSGRGPNATFFPGFVIPKVYVVQPGDISGGVCTISMSSVLGADESPVEIFLPAGLSAPTGLGVVTSTSGGTLAAATYYYKITAVNSLGETTGSNEVNVTTTGSTSSNTLTWPVTPGATSYNVYRSTTAGSELKLASNITALTYVDTAAGSPSGSVPGTNTTATGGPPAYWQQNGAQFFLKVEQLPGGSLTANPIRYTETGSAASLTVTYNPFAKTLKFPNGAVASGDIFRLVFLSYNTDSFPLTVPTNSPDTTDRAAVMARSTPISINAGKVKRIQSAQIKFSLKREQVQGVGEVSIIYGPPMIPDVAISFDLKEYDNRVLTLMAQGSANMTDGGGTIANDFQELSYITRMELANNYPFVVAVNDPFSSGTLITLTTPQFVAKDIAFDSTNKSDNTIKVTGMDIQGALTLSYTHP